MMDSFLNGPLASSSCGRTRICHSTLLTATFCFASMLAFPMVGQEQDQATSSSKYSVSQKAKEIHFRSYVWDGHNDLPWAIREKGERDFNKVDIRLNQPDLHTDIEKLRKGNVGAQFWSVFVPVDTIKAGTSFQTTVEQIQIVRALLDKYPDVFELALTAKDVERIRSQGKIASLIGMEGGHSIENSIQKLRQLHAMGARYMTLTHSETLDWADSGTDTPKSDGLSPFGEEVVREMNQLGMLVDLSHVSPATMEDALRISQVPVIFSHSSAKTVSDHPRNVPDEILQKLPANGGIVMVNFFSGFVVPESSKILMKMFDVRRALKEKYPNDQEAFDKEMKKWQVANPFPAGEASMVVDHIDHIVKMAGIDHVGLGSDYDGISKTPRGIEDVSTYPVLTEIMLQRGYSEGDIHKVLSGNMMRVMKQAIDARIQTSR